MTVPHYITQLCDYGSCRGATEFWKHDLHGHGYFPITTTVWTLGGMHHFPGPIQPCLVSVPCIFFPCGVTNTCTKQIFQSKKEDRRTIIGTTGLLLWVWLHLQPPRTFFITAFLVPPRKREPVSLACIFFLLLNWKHASHLLGVCAHELNLFFIT